jgi:hypothetical protein
MAARALSALGQMHGWPPAGPVVRPAGRSVLTIRSTSRGSWRRARRRRGRPTLGAEVNALTNDDDGAPGNGS